MSMFAFVQLKYIESKEKKKNQIPCVCAHIWPIKLIRILISDNVTYSCITFNRIKRLMILC